MRCILEKKDYGLKDLQFEKVERKMLLCAAAMKIQVQQTCGLASYIPYMYLLYHTGRVLHMRQPLHDVVL